MAGTNLLIYNDDMTKPTATPDAYVTVKFNPKTFTCRQGQQEEYTHDVWLTVTLDGETVMILSITSPEWSFTIAAAQLKSKNSFSIGLSPYVTCDFRDEWSVASEIIPVVVQQQGQNPLVAQPTVYLGQTATLTLSVSGGLIKSLN